MKKNKQLTMLKEKLEDLKDKIADIEGSVEDKITENPIQSVSIAFGVGLLSGAIMGALLKKK